MTQPFLEESVDGKTCPNGHGQLLKFREPIEIGLLLPLFLLDVLYERDEKGESIECGKIVAVCPVCSYVETIGGFADE